MESDEENYLGRHSVTALSAESQEEMGSGLEVVGACNLLETLTTLMTTQSQSRKETVDPMKSFLSPKHNMKIASYLQRSNTE